MRYRVPFRLRPFQRRFLKSAFAPGVSSSALSIPRGNGKSSLSALLAFRSVWPGDPLFRKGAENHLVGTSLGALRRTTFGVLREIVENSGHAHRYKVTESTLQAVVTHRDTGTKISALPASGKGAMGLLRARLILADEPASWKVTDGETMHDALEGAIGKPGVDLHVCYVGTVAPSFEGHWWYDLLHDGSTRTRHVTLIEGKGKWDCPHNIRKANPLMWFFPESRRRLLDERDAGRMDDRLQARFKSYRLNTPSADASDVVLRIEDWQSVLSRPVPVRDGVCVVGLDMGRERAFSSVAALWTNGRLEVTAIAPGIPSLPEQERRDGVPTGTYTRLADTGALVVAEGYRRPPADLVGDVVRGYEPAGVFCDKDRLGELYDAGIDPISCLPGWSFWTSAIRQLRLLASNGPLSVPVGSRSLLQASLREAKVENSNAGGHRLVKRRKNNKSRDDAVAAVLVAAAQWPQLAELSRPAWIVHGSG